MELPRRNSKEARIPRNRFSQDSHIHTMANEKWRSPTRSISSPVEVKCKNNIHEDGDDKRNEMIENEAATLLKFHIIPITSNIKDDNQRLVAITL